MLISRHQSRADHSSRGPSLAIHLSQLLMRAETRGGESLLSSDSGSSLAGIHHHRLPITTISTFSKLTTAGWRFPKNYRCVPSSTEPSRRRPGGVRDVFGGELAVRGSASLESDEVRSR